MWGNLGNFSDLAKRAQELQEQAAKTQVGVSFGGGGFFNMDSLLQQEDEKPKPKSQLSATQISEPSSATAGRSSSSSSSTSFRSNIKPLAALTQPQIPPPKPPADIKGKLVIPKANKATPIKTAFSSTEDDAAAAAAAATFSTNMFGTPLPPSKDRVPKLDLETANGAFQPLPQLSSSRSGTASSESSPNEPRSHKEEKKATTMEMDRNLATRLEMSFEEPKMENGGGGRDDGGGDSGDGDDGDENDVPTSVNDPVPASPETQQTCMEEETRRKEEISLTSIGQDVDNGDKAHTEVDPAEPSESMVSDVPTSDLSSFDPAPTLSSSIPDALGGIAESNNADHTIASHSAETGVTVDKAYVDDPNEPSSGNRDSFPETSTEDMAAPSGTVTGRSSGSGSSSYDQSNTSEYQAPQRMDRDCSTSAKMDSEVGKEPALPLAGAIAESVPEQLLEQFSSQLKRLEENHQLEQQVLHEQHQQELSQLARQLQQMRQELDQAMSDKNRQKESYTLQLDSLQHELEGTQQLLQAKGKEDRKQQDVHLKQLRKMEKEMNEKEAANEQLRQELKEKEKSMEEVQEELHSSRDEYATLKERVKAVAGELKERRAECRTLQSEVAMLRDINNSLNDKITSLEAQGMDMNKSSQETTMEISTLRGQVMDKDKELQEAQDRIAVEIKKGEDALAAYKRKAQQSLSLANSRTASAVQAKEEAEMEARAARTTADSAMEKAVTAELKGKEVMARAEAYVKDMQEQVAKLDEIKSKLDEATTQLEQVRLDASTAQESNEQLRCELQSVHGRLKAEQMTNETLRNDLQQATNRSIELLDEVERLRREGQKLRDDWKQRVSERNDKDHSATDSSTNVGSSMEMVPAKRTVEAEATIAMLQQELDDANQAIRELKETLKATVEEQSRRQPSSHQNGGPHHSHPPNNANNYADSSTASTSSGAGGMPLFYAMEKQAELTQARNEIARLANLLGDSEATKQEAVEEMEGMKRHLMDIQSQLERQRRLTTTTTTTGNASDADERGSATNVEYLKNIVWKFLNAKTLAEKKTLLPVIGTVLCLTPQEQQQAMEQLDRDGKLSLDAVTNSVRNLRWG